MSLPEQKSFDGMFRGIVTDNTGPNGQCKVWIPGIYPDEFKGLPSALPWAEPAMPIFGGSYVSNTSQLKDDEHAPLVKMETGFVGWPHKGAHVWCFFDQGNWMHPIYFAAIQSGTNNENGSGWMSEHNQQWVLKTDNVRIRVDEDPVSGTCKFDTYNSNCTRNSKPKQLKDVPTRVDIEVAGNVNIFINGNINMHVSGNIYKEHYGDLHESHFGNKYIRHEGNNEIEHIGNTDSYQQGNNKIEHIGNNEIEHNGNNNITQIGYDDLNRTGNTMKVLDGERNTSITQNDTLNVDGNCSLTCGKNDSKIISNNILYHSKNSSSLSSDGNSNMSSKGNFNINSSKNIVAKGTTIRLN